MVDPGPELLDTVVLSIRNIVSSSATIAVSIIAYGIELRTAMTSSENSCTCTLAYLGFTAFST